jgi:hypothetical protein
MAKGKNTKNNIVKSKQNSASTPQTPAAENSPKEVVSDKASKNAEKTAEALKEARKEAKDMFEDMSDIDDAVKSIGEGIDKNNKGFKTFSKFANTIKESSRSIATTLGKQNDLTISEVKYVKKISAAKNKFFSEEKRLGKLLKNKVINEQQFNKYTEAAARNYGKVVEGFEATSTAGKQLKKSMEATADGTMDFTKNMQKADGFMESFLSNMEGTVPLANEVGNVFKSLKNGVGIKAAIGALAGAATYLAYKQGMLGDYFGKVASFNMKDQIVENEIALKKAQNNASFAIQEAGIQFAAQMSTALSNFKQDLRNGFFGEALSGLGRQAVSLLAKAGFSAKDVADASLSVSGNLGAGAESSQRLGKEVAVFSKTMGIGADQATDLASNFRVMDGSSAEQALNMLEGTRQMAKMMGLNPGDVMKDMADSTKEIAQYNFRSGKELQKQVIAVKAMGGNFNKIASAGRNMVLNYKDSIKAEMELSAMLGKSINLSEVRAKFASSDIPGAVKALQDELGGIDLSSLDFFSKDAISQSLGGMDFEEIARIGSGNYGEIAKNTKDLDQGIDKSSKAVINASMEQTNNQRLNIEYSIAETKAMNAAQIQAQASIAQQQIENQKSLNGVMIDNDYLQLKANLAFLRTLGTELPGMLLSGLVGGLTTFLPTLLSKAWAFFTGGGTTAEIAAGTAGSMSAATAATFAAGAAGFWSLGKGMYNVGSNEAQRGGKGGGWQTAGNVLAGVGAEFANVLDYASFGLLQKGTDAMGMSLAGINISQLEKFRSAYRSKEGQQIGIGSAGNQKLANWVASNMDYLSRGGLEDEVKDFQKAVQDGLIKTNVSIADQVVSNASQTTKSIEKVSMSSIDEIERQVTENYNKAKSANSKMISETSKTITKMTGDALGAFSPTGKGGKSGPTSTGNGIMSSGPAPTGFSIKNLNTNSGPLGSGLPGYTPGTSSAFSLPGATKSAPQPTVTARIMAAPVYDVNAEIGADMSMKIYSLLQAWSTKSTGTNVYLDGDKVNDTLRNSYKSKRAMYVVG